jgi:hypothetical protein
MKKLFTGFALVVFAVSLASAQQASSDKSSSTAQPKKDASVSADTKAKATDVQKSGQPTYHSVMDRSKSDDQPEPLVVPAGTEIRVDMVSNKVVVPVRVGFTTAIPALSKVSVKIDRVYPPSAYDASGSLLNSATVRYAEYGVLTRVTVNGVTYEVESNSVPLGTPGSSAVTAGNSMPDSVHEVKFELSAPLSIPR